MIKKNTQPTTVDKDTTPMMRQYFRAREEHPDAVLFFRMGDFYEMFYDDAKLAAEVLGITLTARSKDKSGTKIPMAGIPVKSLNGYVRRLLQGGHKVAICEQVEDPKTTKGIVDREVVQVITPGTFMDEERLEDARALHLAAVIAEGDTVGVAWVDVSTGRFHAEDVADPRQCEATLLAVAPAECLYPEGTRPEDFPALAWLAEQFPSCTTTPFSEWNFERNTGRERLLAHFGTRSLEGFGCEHLGPALRAAGALIHYLRETQRQALPHISRLIPSRSSKRLLLDAATHRALDLVEVARTGERRGSLLGVMDRTRTPMGARMLRDWIVAPLTERAEILARQSAVKELVEDRRRTDDIREALRAVRDVERLTSRLPLGRINGRDMRALEASIAALPNIVELLSAFESHRLAELRDAVNLEELLPIAESIDEAIVEEPPVTITEGGVIRDGHDDELDSLREISREGVSWIARFQEEETQRTGIPTLKVGYNRVFGYYIEVTHTHKDRIPEEYTRKQTLKNAERYITPALKEQEQQVLGAKERAQNLEHELFEKLRASIQEKMLLLQQTAGALARLDALLSLAFVAIDEDWVAPEIVEEPRLDIREGRHPVLSTRDWLKNDFVANDVMLGGNSGSLAIITGPNMAGKSTYIRQAALITLLAQVGSFVPADSAVVGVADRIFTRVGAADELSRGQSTFMVEMTETANILNNATERSLVILDEVGRGTSTLDGISLAWSIAEYLIEHSGARTLFATHYHELTELTERFGDRVVNLNVAVREWQDEIVFLHKIIEGSTDKAYGIHVARLAGIPTTVLDRARDILSHLEQEHLSGKTSLGAVETREDSAQLELFGVVNDELAKRVEQLDINNMTPLEALQALAELKKL